MPLVSMRRLLEDAASGHYAVCYCEAWNLESLQGIVMAAEEAEAPFVAGFNGGFLGHPGRSSVENLAYYAGMGKGLADVGPPVAFLLNETDDFKQITLGIELGFNAVMVENAHLGFEEYRKLVKKVVRLAHNAGASVEAAIGRLPDGSTGSERGGQRTDLGVTRSFVEDTEVDALSVSVGNVHIMTRGKASIDLDALRRIREVVDVPLVLHGGSGIPAEQVKAAIARGVAKVNFGTVLKQAYLTVVRSKLADYDEVKNPHLFVGMGGEQDILVAGREAVKNRVREISDLCGAAGKAGTERGAVLPRESERTV